ncbi:MAG: hypothetical protein ACR2PI_03100 [Hyphomicrobiaceae bacterium]
MTFSVRLASNEKPRLSARADAGDVKTSNHLHEFCQGISFGVGMLIVLVVAFWAISAAAGSMPSLQWLQTQWLSLF